MSYKFVENHLELDKLPKKLKKITGTRLAAIHGLNTWVSPFEVWCAITKTYEDPFEDSIYTIAGKVIESKVIKYLQTVMFMDIESPTDVYGEDYFKKTWGDFFPEHKVLGGSWDALGDDYIVEIKTTRRAEDWEHDIPTNYKLQAALYAYLKGFDKCVVTVSFLDSKDYPIKRVDGTFDTSTTEQYVPSVDNTKIYEFKVSEAFPNFEKEYINPVLHFWNKYVKTGISPDFDEKRDGRILEELRKNHVEVTDENISKLLAEADDIQATIDGIEEVLAENKKRLSAITDKMKEYMMDNFREGDKKVELDGAKYKWTLAKSARATVDTKALKADGLYEKYAKSSEVFTLKKSLIEEENKHD